jgi:hypothetical protein
LEEPEEEVEEENQTGCTQQFCLQNYKICLCNRNKKEVRSNFQFNQAGKTHTKRVLMKCDQKSLDLLMNFRVCGDKNPMTEERNAKNFR